MPPETIVAALRRWATFAPERPAYHLLGESNEIVSSLSYATLDRRARAIAAQLAAHRLPPDACAVLLYPEGLDFVAAFIGCLYAGIIAVPAPFPGALRSTQDGQRLQSILADSQAALLLTTAAGSQSLDGSTPVLLTDGLDESAGEEWEPAIDEQGIAYIQYTSGSTAAPKGIIVTHANLAHSLAELHNTWGYDVNSAALTWMPHVHDYGLVEGVLRPLSGGIPCTIMSPWSFVRRPIRWLQAISRYRITHSGGATFAYDWCVRQIAPEKRQALDLSAWQVALIGAEPIQPAVIERFTEAFGPCGFRQDAFCPGYGLAEVTLVATAKLKGTPLTLRQVMVGAHSAYLTGCGHPPGDGQALIVNPESLRPCTAGEVGEIWVSGPSVAGGYWRRPSETQATFHGYLAESDTGPFLRTGDLGLLDADELFITGRLKDMIIVRGQNYYPQDIEWALADCHPAVEGQLAAVFGVPAEGGEQIVILQEVNPRHWPDSPWPQVMEALRQRVAGQFELPVQGVVLLRRGDLPKTSSGKVQRHACRTTYLAGGWKPVATWQKPEMSAVEEGDLNDADLVTRLTAVWQTFLHTPVGPDDNFFALGGDSLTALRMVLAVEEATGQTVPTEFFREPTVAHLARLLAGGSAPIAAPEPDAAKMTTETPIGRQHAHPWRRRARALPQRTRVRVRTVIEAHAFRLPYFEGFQWLMAWCGRPWVQALLYPKESQLVRRFAASMGTPPAQTPLEIQLSLVAHCIHMKRKTGLELGEHGPLVREPREAARLQLLGSEAWTRYFDLQGSANLEEALLQGRGIICVGPHTPTRFVVREFLKKRFEQHEMVGYPAYRSAWQDLLADEGVSFSEGKTAARSAVTITAARTLAQGGVVGMAGDQEDAEAGQPTIIGDRLHHLVAGFAELAVSTQAAIVPFYTQLRQEGRIHIRFLPPLLWDREDSRETQIRAIMAQYGAVQTELWRQAPGALLNGTVTRHLTCPLAAATQLTWEQSGE